MSAHFSGFLTLSRRWRSTGLLALASASLATLVACGGGGDPANEVPPAAATSVTVGAISGFGSVIVNGVRFDDSSANVVDDSGHSLGRSALKLGAQVEVEASSIDRSGGTGKATLFRVGSSLLGLVDAVDVAGSTLSLLGQPVVVTATTVFDSSLSGGLSAVAVGAVLEVHAQYDSATATWRATRVEPAAGATAYRLKGIITALDTSAQTFSIGSTVVNYASATAVPANLAVGGWVRAQLDTTAVAGQWIATRVDNGTRHIEDHSEAEVKGLITSFSSATQFSINGLAVDASAASFPNGRTGVVLGALVEVRGAVVNGVLVATSVSLEHAEHEGSGHDFELHGALSALDTVAKTFVLRDQTVSYAAVSTWRGVTEAQLANGLNIEVKASLSADRTQLTASDIHKED
jgi:hypothetical protein